MTSYESQETVGTGKDPREDVRGRVTDIAVSIPDYELAHAILDLSRTARREMKAAGLLDTYAEASPKNASGLLLQHLMPEISRRLNEGADAPLILTREEGRDGPMPSVSGQEMRRLVGVSWEKCKFDKVGADVRRLFDPDHEQGERIFATEVLGAPPEGGNILEIALGRCAPPDMNAISRWRDPFAERVLASSREKGIETLNWSPAMRAAPEIDPDPDPA